jgi:hypothetical protein
MFVVALLVVLVAGYAVLIVSSILLGFVIVPLAGLLHPLKTTFPVINGLLQGSLSMWLTTKCNIWMFELMTDSMPTWVPVGFACFVIAMEWGKLRRDQHVVNAMIDGNYGEMPENPDDATWVKAARAKADLEARRMTNRMSPFKMIGYLIGLLAALLIGT